MHRLKESTPRKMRKNFLNWVLFLLMIKYGIKIKLIQNAPNLVHRMENLLPNGTILLLKVMNLQMNKNTIVLVQGKNQEKFMLKTYVNLVLVLLYVIIVINGKMDQRY